MKRRRLKRFLEKKAFILVLILCVLSAAGMYGMYKMEFDQAEDNEFEVAQGLADLNEAPEDVENIEVKGRAETDTQKSLETIGGSAIASGAEGAMAQNDSPVDPAGSDNAAVNPNANPEGLNAEIDPAPDEGTPAIAAAQSLHFSSKDKIKWPVKGNIIMDFSPDSTIYFATLDQYRCNPAIFIQASTGTEVVSCADGMVAAIGEDEELGKTLTVDLGDGYQAVYGQLENIQVALDAKVAAGDVLANVSVPSKYFGVEGSHLYFQMLKDGEPVNPRAYLE